MDKINEVLKKYNYSYSYSKDKYIIKLYKKNILVSDMISSEKFDNKYASFSLICLIDSVFDGMKNNDWIKGKDETELLKRELTLIKKELKKY